METIIIYNNKKGLIKITSNPQGLGVVILPIKNNDPKKEDSSLWDFLGVPAI